MTHYEAAKVLRLERALVQPAALTEALSLAIAALSAQAAKPVAVAWLPDDGAYLIRFDDADRKDEFFAMSGARAAAIHRYKQISQAWNAHLFVKIDSNARDESTPSLQLDALAGAGAALAETIARSEGDAMQAMVIRVEKMLCEKLGRNWAPAGMSVESLINDLASSQARVKELEAQQTWQPMSTAPKDGTRILMSEAGTHQQSFRQWQGPESGIPAHWPVGWRDSLFVLHEDEVEGWMPAPPALTGAQR